MSYKVEKVNPYNADQRKNEQVVRMFNDIAPSYDRLNGTLSLGIDGYWRSDSLKELRKYKPRHMLDIATGTGDFAILAQKILQPETITAVDISEGMMEVGRKKVARKGIADIIRFEYQDCAEMSFADNSFDAATVSFGVRNFEDIDKSFQEVLRVLKPGGVFLFIELTTPDKSPVKELYGTYTKHVMPFLSGLFDTEQRAYQYLPESIAAFPQGREMMLILKKNGFRNIRLRRYTLGITTLYIAEK
ncbi:MAG: bifunctional demethylmenaquinone methyltransferase/2-methoxy-6-polyprenyl-1,4-benzoquinol methylase UbiE [Bacteroidales bacterium]|jgi:demethylmenaquinone methyltransferase/2-methoxy-6-polyprenyl-1,4-benzoquinol methylase|nr:bifunctional demethylmenaquinone methyltransferase/2-methoxy-6-polyprenyl-1,4-benzoquinol methylase UbiE [Bacteroidales bacterium]